MFLVALARSATTTGQRPDGMLAKDNAKTKFSRNCEQVHNNLDFIEIIRLRLHPSSLGSVFQFPLDIPLTAKIFCKPLVKTPVEYPASKDLVQVFSLLGSCYSSDSSVCTSSLFLFLPILIPTFFTFFFCNACGFQHVNVISSILGNSFNKSSATSLATFSNKI